MKGMSRIALLWKNTGAPRRVEVTNGTLASVRQVRRRLIVSVANARTAPGADQTIVTVRGAQASSLPTRVSESQARGSNFERNSDSFSFFLRDVSGQNPIFLPDHGVAVTVARDKRSYADIAHAIEKQGGQTSLQQIEKEPEESFDAAAANTTHASCQTWLGLSRDMRIFTLGFRDIRDMAKGWDWVEPKFHAKQIKLRETGDKQLTYQLQIGRGHGCTRQLTRRLEDGTLPILNATLLDGGIRYEVTAFVTLELRALIARNVRGTHFLVADGHGHCHMFTPKQHEWFSELLLGEINREEETILCYRVRAINEANQPRYAWMHAPTRPGTTQALDENGFAKFDSGRVYCVNRLSGQPLRQREIAVLVPPKREAVFEFFIPHQPLLPKRAARLARFNFDEKLAECRAYWRNKLGHGAEILLPEARVNEMVHAGLLHLDLVTYGLEPKGTLAPTIGVYTPIGSESAPIIQFLDSMGWHDVAERSLQYFLDKQHDDGFIQNFYDYMLETGAALWSMGEHWRYTRDTVWLERVAPKLLKSCDYILRWRERNKRPELKGKGYGMLEGKVADPEDPYHSFMLNGYAYLGLARVAEALAKLNPRESKRLASEAAALKADIRTSFFEAMARSPVAPLGDGTWTPTVPPWAENDRGPVGLYAQPGNWHMHGTFFCRDLTLGPIYLAFQEVLDPHERATNWLLNYHAEMMHERNVGLGQPYYCRHDWLHLKRGEVKAFLKTYYNAFASMADRETYTFWEHYIGASPHKTHEEGWFLMQTRWMLWLEDGDTLRLLSGIPRAWLEHGKTIEMENVASYFGAFSLRVESSLRRGVIEAWVDCKSDRQPNRIELRLPHPGRKQPRKVTGGTYCPERETICVDRFHASARVKVAF